MASAAAEIAEGGERRFAYIYEATTQPKGVVEYEQYVTWKAHKEDDGSFDRLDLRHELEIGLTDRLQLGLYVADWRWENGRSVGDDGAEYRDSAVEVIYGITNPTVDPIGLALYGEYKIGPELHELEGKVILQKNTGPWVIGYNVTIAGEWEDEGGAWEPKGEFAQAVGASYQFAPQFTAGVELLHEIEFPDWSEAEESVVYVGPNASYRQGQWWVTVSPLFQVTDVDGEADFQTRLLFGIHF